jgi:hypothetical protein
MVFEVLTVMTMKYAVVWNGTLKFSLKMEAEGPSETVQLYEEQAITSQTPALFSSWVLFSNSGSFKFSAVPT